jgi:hypothetical protein
MGRRLGAAVVPTEPILGSCNLRALHIGLDLDLVVAR